MKYSHGCYLLFILFLLSFTAQSQDKRIAPYIKAWKVSDTSQTRLAEETYAPYRKVRDRKNLPRDQKLVAELYQYLRNHPNDRLHVRIVMFDILIKTSHKIWQSKADLENMKNAIKIAYKLKDEQLKSELFAIYALANYWDDSKFLLYSFKAILIQQKLGLKLFNFKQNRYFQLSSALYRAERYKESISYGLHSLHEDKTSNEKDSADYIFQNDIIGASYLKLKKLDSAAYYYQNILNMLRKYRFDVQIMNDIWGAIAKGRIGQVLLLKGDEKEGLKLVEEYLTTVKQNKDSINIAIGENLIAQVKYNQKKYTEAISRWKISAHIATKMKLDEERVSSLYGIAKSFAELKHTDSTFKYFKLYEQIRDKHRDWLNSLETERLKLEMELEDLQSNIEKANLKVEFEKMVRNFILAFILFLTIIAVLLIKNRLNKVKNQKLLLIAKQQETEKHMYEARKHVEEFSKHILEKDRIIYDLSKALKNNKIIDFDKENNSLLKYILVTDQELAKFRLMITDAYPGFFVRLEAILKNITPAEERLASLICLKLKDSQMANMLGISKESVARSKRRLKQRLPIPEGETLENYIYKLATWYPQDAY
ncbi:helix-turn-helix transcriptional regulator [Pedobacter insulae]|uniref:HTH luxR-type domain-containing protein n=1 Tax=Pedobacter insulae TaxID=414048 RepID=A0A1I2ZGF2_9SPHI|nr:hypothetical protein [Pedobacter insulae]SFH36898.1 hypothetical protein SAMN04489864_11010 [Pedobacter insulae]